ncbi:unnamed protein product [Bathycoccus prasinos]|jgi:hypothetical protein
MGHFDAVVRRKRFVLSSEKEKKTPPYSKVDEKKTLSLPASSPVPRRRPLERIEFEGDDDEEEEEEEEEEEGEGEEEDEDEEFRGVKSVGKRKARRTNASTRDSSDSDLGWVEEHDRKHKVKKTTSFELGTPEKKSERKSERQQAQTQKRREERRSFKKKMTTKKKDRLEDSSEDDTAESYEEDSSESEADDEMDKNMRQELDRAIDNMHGWKRRVWKNRSNVNPASKDTSALPTGGWNGTIY